MRPINDITVNSRFKKDLKLQIHLYMVFFSDDRFLDSLHKDLSETKMTKLGVGHFKSVSGHFSANYINSFHN